MLSLETLAESSNGFVVLEEMEEVESQRRREKDETEKERERTAIGGIPGISELMYMAMES